MDKQILISAGDAITAKLVEEAGFNGIWVSGFEASARLGLADNGSITMNEMLNICKPIVRAVKIPVYVDVDTGYQNFQRTVFEFEEIGVAGICVEDNVPELKQNSLWGSKIPLMDMKEFGKKINIPHKLKIIARTEALIRNYGEDECRSRLNYYSDCGADILLPHTRNFLLHLDNFFRTMPKPLAIVPTKFPEITNEHLFYIGYSMIIYANQTERIKIKAIRGALKLLKEKECMLSIEQTLSATLEDMKELMPNG